VAFTKEERKIDSHIVRQAVKELGRHGQEARQFLRGRSRLLNTAAVVLLLAMVSALSVLATTRGWFSSKPQQQSAHKAGEKIEETGAITESEAMQPTAIPAATSAPAPSSSAQGDAPLATDTPHSSPAVPEPGTTTPAPQPNAVEAGQEERDHLAVEEFLKGLGSISMVDSAVRATEGLLQAWKVESLRKKEWHKRALDLTAIAQTRQLEYLPLTGSVNLLSLLDLPMIMELIVPGTEGSRFVLLLGLSDDRCRLFLDHERNLPLQVLSDNWFGKGYMFWKDFEEIGVPLTVGSVGNNVKRLHDMLTKAQGTAALPSSESGRDNVFNRQTEAAVARFQRAKRLTPDGIAGPLTLILLYNSLSTYTHPSLSVGAELQPKETPVALESATPRSLQKERALLYEHHS
jgi:general secretion pathway protein A